MPQHDSAKKVETKPSLGFSATAALKNAAELWFLTAVAGQWVFFLYIAAYYISPTLREGAGALAGTHLPKSYIPGDVIGNMAVVAHLFLAAVVMGTGPLQLVPQIRNRFGIFHRWNGRLYIIAACITGISGLYMVWIRGSVGGMVQHIGISLNAVLIIACSVMALRHALVRDIRRHRRWALRLFLVVAGVWFARLGLWFWVYLTGGAGVDLRTFTGPFLNILNFAQYLVPLAVLEIFFYARDHAGAYGRFAMAAALLMLTFATAIGIQQASVRLWLPRI